MDRSNESVVSIRNVKHVNGGRYRCEVSGEAPDFETDFTEANMTVIGSLQSAFIIQQNLNLIDIARFAAAGSHHR